LAPLKKIPSSKESSQPFLFSFIGKTSWPKQRKVQRFKILPGVGGNKIF
jgi:hypothetical protein